MNLIAGILIFHTFQFRFIVANTIKSRIKCLEKGHKLEP